MSGRDRALVGVTGMSPNPVLLVIYSAEMP